MRVLLVSGPARGGMLTWVREAARVLSEASGSVAVAAPHTVAGVENLTSFRLAVGERLLPGAGLTEGLRLAARAFGADLLHAHGLRAGFAARRTGLPFVYTLHGFPPGGARGALFRMGEGRVLRSARAVSAVSEELATYALATGGRRAQVIAPLPPVPPHPLPIPDGETVLGTLARLSPEKGVDTLLTAFAHLAPRERGMRLVIGGEGPEGPRLEALASSLGVAGETSFLGWVGESEDFFRGVSLYIQPSLREGFGLAACEAVSAGRPVVVSDTGGLPSAAGDGPWARLVPPGDAEALARAIREILDEDLAALGERAHAFARRRADAGTFAANLLAFYEGALSDKKTGE